MQLPNTHHAILLLANFAVSVAASAQVIEIGGTIATIGLSKQAIASTFSEKRVVRTSDDDLWLIGTNEKSPDLLGTLLFHNGRLCEASRPWVSGSSRETLDSMISILSKSPGPASTHSWHSEEPKFSTRCSRVDLVGKRFLNLCTTTGEMASISIEEGVGGCGSWQEGIHKPPNKGPLAQKDGAELLIAHAYEPPRPLQIDGYVAPWIHDEWEDTLRQEAEMALTPLIEAARQSGIKARSIVLKGTPFKAITDAAGSEHADLVVMGTHGRTGLSRLVLGSVAARVAASAPCPVLTVRAL